MQFRKNTIKSISESRAAMKEEISKIHAIRVCLIKLHLPPFSVEEMTQELYSFVKGSQDNYYLDYPDCHPKILLSGIYDYLKMNEIIL